MGKVMEALLKFNPEAKGEDTIELYGMHKEIEEASNYLKKLGYVCDNEAIGHYPKRYGGIIVCRYSVPGFLILPSKSNVKEGKKIGSAVNAEVLKMLVSRKEKAQ